MQPTERIADDEATVREATKAFDGPADWTRVGPPTVWIVQRYICMSRSLTIDLPDLNRLCGASTRRIDCLLRASRYCKNDRPPLSPGGRKTTGREEGAAGGRRNAQGPSLTPIKHVLVAGAIGRQRDRSPRSDIFGRSADIRRKPPTCCNAQVGSPGPYVTSIAGPHGDA
jgi:hypothetical protein